MQVAVRVCWIEYERGWGCRPDGVTLHRNEEEAKQHIQEYWSRQPKNHIPDCYSSPGEPELVRVTKEEYERVQREGWFWR